MNLKTDFICETTCLDLKYGTGKSCFFMMFIDGVGDAFATLIQKSCKR